MLSDVNIDCIAVFANFTLYFLKYEHFTGEY